MRVHLSSSMQCWLWGSTTTLLEEGETHFLHWQSSLPHHPRWLTTRWRSRGRYRQQQDPLTMRHKQRTTVNLKLSSFQSRFGISELPFKLVNSFLSRRKVDKKLNSLQKTAFPSGRSSSRDKNRANKNVERHRGDPRLCRSLTQAGGERLKPQKHAHARTLWV